MYTTIINRQDTCWARFVWKDARPPLFSPQQNGAKNHWIAWQCTFKRTESLIVPKSSPMQMLGCAGVAEDQIIGLKVWKSNARRRESFLATMRKIPWQSRKELHLQLAASLWSLAWFTAMVFDALQFNSYVFSEECNWKKFIRSTKGGICGVRTQRQPHHHHTGHPVETSGCGRATFGFRRAPATAWTRWCILANKGFTNLAIVTKFSPLPEPCDNGKTTTCGSVYRAKSVNGERDGSGRP